MFTDMQRVLSYKKPLEGASLKITNPPVCNSILITGLSEKTSKQAIEMYFENERNGGGKIYGDVIYQKDHQRAVVSFCDPEGIFEYLYAYEFIFKLQTLNFKT